MTFPVFLEDFAANTSFGDFGGAVNGMSVDASEHHTGAKSLKFVEPAMGNYTGGAIKIANAVDLSAYDALTFWAKADVAGSVDSLGYGNDGNGNSEYSLQFAAPQGLTTAWQKFVVPIPDPASFNAVAGLFYFATGGGAAYSAIYFDDIQFEKLGAAVIGAGSAAIATETQAVDVGASVTLHGASLTYPINGAMQTYIGSQGFPGKWLAYESDMPAVATVDATGHISGVSAGTAMITAKLGGVAAAGTTTVNVSIPMVPQDTAPAPVVAEADVISLFSSTYSDPTHVATVDTWHTAWSGAAIVDPFMIGNHAVKEYTGLGFVGIEFLAQPMFANEIDATSMSALHIDFWSPDVNSLKVKLVDFGADKAYGGGDDTEAEVAFDPAKIMHGQWIAAELMMSDYLTVNPNWNRSHLAQMIIETANDPTGAVFIDNVYFHK